MRVKESLWRYVNVQIGTLRYIEGCRHTYALQNNTAEAMSNEDYRSFVALNQYFSLVPTGLHRSRTCVLLLSLTRSPTMCRA